MEYYSAIKRNAFESVLMKWMNLEPIIQIEVSQKERDKYHTLMDIYIQNPEKRYLRISLKGSSGETETILMDIGRGEDRVRCMGIVSWKLTLPYVIGIRSDQSLSHVRLFTTP